ncbi:MAG: RNA polymerase factor sigma-54 [Planctomycetaceae bacterium]|nr:RNA polymerase factor sigma-54 [Planctomycetaceae bacterium]
MRLSFGQEFKQEQRTILTQRMIQSMEILQLPLQQLEERIEQEMEQNPVLEMHEDEPDESSDSYDTQADEDAESRFEREDELPQGDSTDGHEDFQIADDFASAYSDTINEQPARSQNWLEQQADLHHDAMANLQMHAMTLQDYLTEQLSWFDVSPELREMTERIISNLDGNGYLLTGINDILGMKATADDRELAKQSWQLVRKLDPPGVGARNLKDCLMLQLRHEMPYFDVMRTVIADHLEDVEKNRLPQIAKKTGFSIADIREAIAEIRRLNPRPGAAFNEQTAAYVVPDVFVDKDDDGCYVVRLDEGRTPRLHISNYYRDLMKHRDTTKETRDYIKQKVGSAQWLIDSIQQRRTTLTRVSQAIVDHQTEFLEYGPASIKPLKMQQIADKVGVHVTTVSRAVDDKWIQTPQGIFPLKRFFSSSVAASDGEEEVAQDAVRLKLQEIIDREDKSKPLNDEELMKALQAEGVSVARRTVVKYRQLMNIPNSRERRVWS